MRKKCAVAGFQKYRRGFVLRNLREKGRKSHVGAVLFLTVGGFFLHLLTMNILGVDYGHKRIGLAFADTDIGVAVPIRAANEPTAEAREARILAEIAKRRIGRVVVGYPLNMDGSVSDKAREVDAFIAKMSVRAEVEFVRVDERLSSYQAECDMAAFSPKKTRTVAARKKNRRTGEVDSRASALFLQEYLDTGEIIGG